MQKKRELKLLFRARKLFSNNVLIVLYSSKENLVINDLFPVTKSFYASLFASLL